MTDRSPTEADLHRALAAATEAVSASLGMTLAAVTPAPRSLEPADGIALRITTTAGGLLVIVGEHAVAEALEQAMFDPAGALGPLVIETAGALGLELPEGEAEKVELPDAEESDEVAALPQDAGR